MDEASGWRLSCTKLNLGEERALPIWTPDGVPMCSAGKCVFYDGKRCEALGFRPDAICEPVVRMMADMLDDAEIEL